MNRAHGRRLVYVLMVCLAAQPLWTYPVADRNGPDAHSPDKPSAVSEVQGPESSDNTPDPQATASTCNLTGDSNTSVSDVQLEINEALGKAAAANDLNNDGTVNAADVQMVINAVLGLGCSAGFPAITDFNPKSGTAGTVVNITGTNFGSSPQISVPQIGSGTINPPLLSASATAVSFVVPAGAATGPITLSTTIGNAPTRTSFTVTPSSGFTLAATPPSASLIQGQSVAYSITLSSTNGFTQLAQLSVAGVPSGVKAAFQPASITAGQTSVLTLTAPANQPIATTNLSISAAAAVDGMPVSGSGAVSLSVVAATTSLIGRTVVANSLETPLAGVTISTLGLDGNGNTTLCTGFSTVSDGAGNFALTNLPMGCVGLQLINFNGTTATNPPGTYAGVNLVFTLVSGQVTASPVLVHLPQISSVETFMVVQNDSVNQVYAYQSIPGLSVTVYAGTTFTLQDGTRPNPFPLAAVQVATDRLPDNKPNVPTMIRDFIVAFQPANTTASQPVAVYFPNTLNTPPGTDMVLMTLDPTHGQMVPYGTGAVSADATQIVPDPDPAHPGHLYGLQHFDWHGAMAAPPPNISPGGDGNGPHCGCPIDLASGIDVITTTDAFISSTRRSVAFVRTLRTASPGAGPFGIGGDHNFDLSLDSLTPSSAASFNLVMPDGRRIPFARQSNGTLINSVNPSAAGAVITTQSNNSAALRWKNGVVYNFQLLPTAYVRGVLLTSITDPNGNTITLTRNPNQTYQITSIADPAGRQFTLTYDNVGGGRITSITDPIGRTLTYTYNSAGYLATFTDANGGMWQYGYNSSGNLITVTDPRNVVIEQNTYDANGRVISQVEADGSTIGLSYVLTNPLAGTSPVMTTTETDQLGRQTVYRFNPQGFLIQATDPLGQSRLFNLAPGTNLPLSITGPGSCPYCGNPAAGDMSYTYDALGNLLTSTDSLRNTYIFTYDPTYNKVTSITDPAGDVTTYQYDGNGNPIKMTDPRGNTNTFTIGSYGLPASATDASGQTTTLQYDTFGDLTAITDPLGDITTIGYDPISRPLEVTDPNGATFFQAWDLLDRTVRTTDGFGNSVLATYDPASNLLTVTDPAGGQTSFTYDALSRLTKRADALNRSQQYGYDADSNLTSYTDRRGQTATFSYDSLNRRISETYADATVSRSYDANSRLTQVNDSQSGIFEHQYDSTGALLSSATPIGSVTYTRDSLHRVASRQAAGQPTVTYKYDAAGNLTQAAASQATVNMTFDVRNALESVSRSNGVVSNYAYDALDRVLSIAHSSGSNTLASFTYGYDPAGHRTGATANPAQTFLTPSATGTFDADDEMTAYGSRTFTSDSNGNRLTDSASGASTTYAWDGRNRLQSITPAGAAATQFTYDFNGNLIRQTSAGSSMNYLLDQWTNVVEILGGASGPMSLLTGANVDSHYATVSSSGQAQFALTDALNSVVASTNGSGAISGTNLFEPFGGTTSSGASFPFAFTGRAPINSSIYYYRRRYYDTSAGRFLSEDPLNLRGGDYNLYRYVRNLPVQFMDPWGTFGAILEETQPGGEVAVGPAAGVSNSQSLLGGFVAPCGHTEGVGPAGITSEGKPMYGGGADVNAIGLQLTFTNANSVADYQSIAGYTTVNLGPVSFTYGFGGNNGTGSFSVGAGLGFGVGVFSGSSNTVVDH